MPLPGMFVRREVMAVSADAWSELTKSVELNPWKVAKLSGASVPGEAGP